MKLISIHLLRNLNIILYGIIFSLVLIPNSAGIDLDFQKQQNLILNSKYIQPSEYKKTKFSFNTEQDFVYYIDHSIKLLKRERVDLDQYQIFTLRSNAPFIFHPLVGCPQKNKKFEHGIILIHDLGASPYQTQPLAYIFKDKCMLVYSILLLGNGTIPSSLIGVSYIEWMKQLDYAVKSISQKVHKVYLAGIGMGGTIALNYTLDKNSQIQGLFLFSPIIYYNNESSLFLSKMALNFNTWNKLNLNTNRVAYNNIPYQAYGELAKLAHLLQRKLKNTKIEVPIFTVWTKDDQIVDFHNSFNSIQAAIKAPTQSIVYYGINHYDLNLFLKTNQIEFISIYNMRDSVYDIDCNGLVMPDYDWWYGQYPAYRDCNHYFQEHSYEKYIECTNHEVFDVGIPSKLNLKRGIFRRSTYNPKFQHMKDAINNFIDQLLPPIQE